MAKFRYIAQTRAGERQEGVLEAADRRTLLAQLGRAGLVPISVQDVQPAAAAPAAPAPTPAPPAPAATTPRLLGRKEKPRRGWRYEKSIRSRVRLKLSELLLFTHELSDLLASGMTLGAALHALVQRKTGKAQDAIVTDLRDEIVSGSSLSAALARWPDSFPTLYVSMVKAGEASGQLPSVLERLVRHFERAQAAREKVTMALVYPLIVTLVGIGAMIFMMTFVSPRFSAMFAELGANLAAYTR